MKVHLKQIPAEGLHLEGEESNRILDLREEWVKPASDIRYALDVGLSGSGLFATGTLAVELELDCVTCLEPFRYSLEVPDFACQTELGTSETVDLTEFIREDILLALPAHPHCDWNGERVCKGAFHRVSEIASEPLPETDEHPSQREVWGALDQLKLK